MRRKEILNEVKVMKKISFVIPIYNVDEYLKECIESILNIDYKSKEIILINDGSTDNSRKICESYEKKYKNILLINQKNQGVSIARNVGIEKASGSYILFIDPDDFYLYDFTNDITNIINNYQNDVILFDYQMYYNTSKKTEIVVRKFNRDHVINKKGKDVLESILRRDPNYSWHLVQGIYRKDFLVENQLYFIANRKYEDVLWLPEVFLKAKKLDYINKSFYVYRLERKGQTTSTFTKQNILDNIFAVNYWEYKTRNSVVINNEQRNLIMNNIVQRYYYTITHFKYLKEPFDRQEVAMAIKDNDNYLKYQNSKKLKIISLLYNIFGLNITSNISYFLLEIRKKLKSL